MQPGDVVKTFANVDDLTKDFNYSPKTTLKRVFRTLSSGTKVIMKLNDYKLAVIGLGYVGLPILNKFSNYMIL